jgi:hypothetical protein
MRTRSTILIVAAAAAPSVFVLLHHFYEIERHSTAGAARVASQRLKPSATASSPSRIWSFPTIRRTTPPAVPALQSPQPPSEDSLASSARAAEAAARAAANAAGSN